MTFGMSDLGDSVVPIYKFEWENGRSVRTDEHDEYMEYPVAIENLATMGKDDPECEVTLVGLES